MHTGIGPFDINSGTVMGYAKANYTKQGFHAGFFTNILNGDADNLLTSDAQGKPIVFNFDTSTYDFEASNVQTFAAKHVVSYGGNLRFNQFELSIAPDADNRDGVRRLRAGRDLPLDDVPVGRRRARRSLRLS